MPQPLPPAVAAGWRLADLAERAGSALDGDGSTVVTRIDSLETAGPGAVTFLTHRRYLAQLATTRASAVILAPDMAAHTTLPKLVDRNPYAAYARVASLLHPRGAVIAGTHPTAIVDPGAHVAASAAIGPRVVVGPGTRIGERASIGAGCVIGADVTIGDDALLHANVTLYDRCVIGPRTILHSGVVIGADGFGNAEEGGRWIKIPQIGRAVIGADVEVGANTTIDRGAIGDTVIEDDVKIDNQIQIGHNCSIGAHTAIAGCAGIAGSVRIGRNCKIGGAAMIGGHLEIPDGTIVSAATPVFSSFDRPGVYTGVFPTVEHREWKRLSAELRRLAELGRRLRALERGAAEHAENTTAGPDRRKEEP